MRERAEQRQVPQIEVVAGVEAEADLMRQLGGPNVAP